MKLIRTVKRSPVEYGSNALTIELTPADIGLPDPTNATDAALTWKKLNMAAVMLVDGNLVKEGLLPEEQFNQTMACYRPHEAK